MIVFNAHPTVSVPTPIWRPRHVAYALASEGHWLACVRKGQRWYLPGGGIEPGESALSALVREVGEEAGLHVVPVLVVAHAGDLKPDDDGPLFRYGPCLLAEVIGPAEQTEPDLELIWLKAPTMVGRFARASHNYFLDQWLLMQNAGDHLRRRDEAMTRTLSAH